MCEDRTDRPHQALAVGVATGWQKCYTNQFVEQSQYKIRGKKEKF